MARRSPAHIRLAYNLAHELVDLAGRHSDGHQLRAVEFMELAIAVENGGCVHFKGRTLKVETEFSGEGVVSGEVFQRRGRTSPGVLIPNSGRTSWRERLWRRRTVRRSIVAADQSFAPANLNAVQYKLNLGDEHSVSRPTAGAGLHLEPKDKMRSLGGNWIIWAMLSAVFAALTAIFGKVGVEGVNSDFATFIRTIVILVVLGMIVVGTGSYQPLNTIAARTYLFLALSALATGASWLCYYRALQAGPASKVAPIDKMSVVLVALFAVIFLGEHLSWRNWMGIGLVAAGAIVVAIR